jgi:hypothetical protein
MEINKVKSKLKFDKNMENNEILECGFWISDWAESAVIH